MLHPPLPPDPTFSQQRATHSSSPDPTSQVQNEATNSKSTQPQSEPGSVPGTAPSSSSIPAGTSVNSSPRNDQPASPDSSTTVLAPRASGLGVVANEQITGLAPILGPPAPPYSNSSESDPGGDGKLIPIPFSSVYSL